MKEKEIWKPVKGYEGLYEVSNLGRVKSLERTVKFGWSYRKTPAIYIKPSLRKRNTLFQKGYYVVGLHNNGKTKYVYIHRLVAMAFISNPLNKPQIDHIDGDTSNNRIDNLRWCTAEENNNFELHKKNNSVAQKISYTRRKDANKGV